MRESNSLVVAGKDSSGVTSIGDIVFVLGHDHGYHGGTSPISDFFIGHHLPSSQGFVEGFQLLLALLRTDKLVNLFENIDEGLGILLSFEVRVFDQIVRKEFGNEGRYFRSSMAITDRKEMDII